MARLAWTALAMNESRNAAFTRLPALAIAWMFALITCLAFAFPAQAHAWYNDVTDSYSASQEVTTNGAALTGGDIPEGTYPISVSCSSYMCKFTNVTATSVGGELWVTFTLSKAYDALYFGTAEQAAAQTDDEGTDYSAYYVTPPLGEYVSRQFSLPIPALNKPITLATYSGGSKGTEKGMWYTRTVSFNSSSEVEKAIKEAKEPSAKEEAKSTETSKTDATSGDNGKTSSKKKSEDEKKSDKKSKKETSKKKETTTSSTTSTTSGTGQSNATASGTGSGTGGSTGNSGSGNSDSKDDEGDKSDGADNAGQGPVAAANAKIGQAISVVGVDVEIPDLPTPNSQASEQQSKSDEVPLPAIIAAVVLVNAALIGAFVFGLRRAWRGGLPHGRDQ